MAYSSLPRSHTRTLQNAIGSEGTICAVQTYMSSRTGKQVTADDIIPEFMRQLNGRGFASITEASIDAILKLTENHQIDRLILFKELLTWTDPAAKQQYGLDRLILPAGKRLKLFKSDGTPEDAKILRASLNHTGEPLTKSTILSHKYTGQPGDDFCSEWATKPCIYNEEVISQQEFINIFNITRKSNLEGHKKFRDTFPQMDITQVDGNFAAQVRKKQCARCWICGQMIYLYKVPNKTEAVIKCGQEEHRFPPGIGNLIGTLMAGPGASTQAALINNELLREGLAPSHAWCNQIKSDISVIMIQGYQYALNIQGLQYYIQKVEEAYNSDLHIDSFELMFMKGDPARLQFLKDAIYNTMGIYIQGLVARLNTPSQGEGHSLQKMIMLRTLFFGTQQCLATLAKVAPEAFTNYFLPRWQGTSLIKQGGGSRSYKQKGGNIDAVVEPDMSILVNVLHNCEADKYTMTKMGELFGDPLTRVIDEYEEAYEQFHNANPTLSYPQIHELVITHYPHLKQGGKRSNQTKKKKNHNIHSKHSFKRPQKKSKKNSLNRK